MKEEDLWFLIRLVVGTDVFRQEDTSSIDERGRLVVFN